MARQHDAHVKAYLWRKASIERNRAKRRAKAQAEGRPMRAWNPIAPEDRQIPRHVRERDKCIAYKRQMRAQRAADTRQHDAHVKAWAKHVERTASRAPKAPTKCAGHVSAWKLARPGDYWAHKYRTDDEFNTKEKVRARMRKLVALDGNIASHFAEYVRRGGSLAKAWDDLLGYSMSTLVAHLKKTLPRGATWQDFRDGDLHIDHIKPRSSFDLTNAEDVRRCWCLSNLQLLHRRDNLAKGARCVVLL